MIIQKDFPFGNPTIESKIVTGIIFLSIILFTSAEVINLYKTNSDNDQN